MVIECLRYGRGKGKRKGENISKGSGRIHSGAQEGEPEDPGLDASRGCSEGGQGRALQQEPRPGFGATLLHVIASLGFSFYRTFQCSSGSFSTGNCERFVSGVNHVPDCSFHVCDLSTISVSPWKEWLFSHGVRLIPEVGFSYVWI